MRTGRREAFGKENEDVDVSRGVFDAPADRSRCLDGGGFGTVAGLARRSASVARSGRDASARGRERLQTVVIATRLAE
jgi:hypothetical protein